MHYLASWGGQFTRLVMTAWKLEQQDEQARLTPKLPVLSGYSRMHACMHIMQASIPKYKHCLNSTRLDVPGLRDLAVLYST